ncbi:hypothetical protein [Streptomyces sp. MST-110588]|uniref:hypothetical protein n=1 Tax=Streptomyces sp. MST-110588 TaxID=2833628 RepID=UPI001F5CBFCD|nr:hypothetical protein [Streptomyces sp. MST-110588]UNO39400.1 hypothetical protein KGS77_06990 [Streptomyces sp. MST-110588]
MAHAALRGPDGRECRARIPAAGRPLVTPAVLLAALAGTGCAAHTPPSPDPPAAPASPSGLRPPAPSPLARSLVLPFDAYEQSLDEYYTVKAAEDLLVRQCMRERGFTWKLLHRTTADTTGLKNRRRYGVIEPDVARTLGYHVVPGLLSPRKSSRNGRQGKTG